jgi:hypothetical protein
MAVSSRNIRSVSNPRPYNTRSYAPPAITSTHWTHTAAYGVALFFAALAIYALVSVFMGKATVFFDDIRYGRPRTTQLTGFVGHGEAQGQPSHFMALNLNRQVVVIELPGGDASQARTIQGPYLFGANEDLTPVFLELRDMDGDGNKDLILDIRREQIVYVNKDGSFRLPTPEEDFRIKQGSP